MDDLRREFGSIDIYLFDQLLRGRLEPPARILDAGCGSGRNLVYLLRCGFEVFGVDADAAAIAEIQRLAAQISPRLPAANFRSESVEAMSFADAHFDAVLSSAVLHFARNEEQFETMLREMWRVLRPGGLFFCRLASTIGMADRMRSMGGRRHRLPDGSERYLVDEPLLLQLTDGLGGELLDPLKTTVVQDRRCMTTWVMRKKSRGG